MKKSFKIFLAGLFLFVAFIDQITKYFIIKKIPSGEFFLIHLKNFQISLKFLLNNSLAFSLPTPDTTLINLIVIILLLFIILKYRKSIINDNVDAAIFVAIFAAALGNLYDRLTLGGVVDFIHIQLFTFFWPAFNFADIIITGGALTFLARNFTKTKKTYEKAN